MELKVWVEGIQRVVCGVTESSTCQDVVYALAHATGQTGRFILVEKWRNSERLLAPQEQPLKVLTKWGEYANDVHFVLRRSTADSKPQSTGNNAPNNNKRQHDFLRSFSPTGGNNKQQQKSPVNNKEIKKSLTFSCGHGSSGSVSSDNSTPPIISDSSQLKPDLNTCRNLKNRDGRSRQEIPKGVVRGIPQKPRENDTQNSGNSKTDRPKHPPPYDEAVSRSSGRFPPSHLSLASPVTNSAQDEESPSSKRPHLATKVDRFSPVDRGSSSNQAQVLPRQPNSHKSPLIMDQNREYGVQSPDLVLRQNDVINVSPNRTKSPSRSPEKSVLSVQSNSSDDSLKAKKTAARFESEKHISSDNKLQSLSQKSSIPAEDSNRDPQYQDLLRLVSLQREKLDNQQSELTQFDAEIVYWESRLQEQEEKLNLLQEEVAHLERTQREQDDELIQLDRRSFSEEVDLGRQEERTLRSELTLARSQLANCETELLQCRQRIRLILEEIAEERRLKALQAEQEKKEQEEQERNIQSQIEALQQQLKDKMVESDSQKNSTEQVKDELKELEAKVAEKQKQVEKLTEEIREANLLSLSLIPADEGKFVIEGSFHNRPGSTRKIIGSPRQLENAVPTNKNPHGVWV